MTKINKHTAYSNMTMTGAAQYQVPVYKVQLVKEDSISSDISSIDQPSQVAAMVMDDLRNEDREKFMIVMLNTKNKVIGFNLVSMGTLNASIVHPREVFKPAIIAGAGSVILIHNHPSGDPSPSQEDIEVTKRMVASGDVLGITVRDHLVIGDGVFVSFREKGLL
jgi:DNA repair protein RadC